MIFSIIIPVYNVAPYLRECLDSVLSQTFTDWEAICVDDGSTDASGAILDEYAAKDARFRVIHQSNAGVSAARNRALDMARSEWVLFLDGDDYLATGHLQFFVDQPHKADVNFLPVRFVNDDGTVKFCRGPRIGVIDSCEGIATYCRKLVFNDTGVNLLGYTWNKFFKLSLINDNHKRFVPNLSVSEDEVFTYAVLDHAKTVTGFSDTGYCYRWHAFGLTHSKRKDHKLLYSSYKDLHATVRNKALKGLLQNRCLNSLASCYAQDRTLSNATLLLHEIADAGFDLVVGKKKRIIAGLFKYNRGLTALFFLCFVRSIAFACDSPTSCEAQERQIVRPGRVLNRLLHRGRSHES